MVARIETGKSIRGVLIYNEKKVEVGVANLLFASDFPLEAKLMKFEQKVRYFRKLTSQNTRAKTNTMHISLNFSPRDKLDKEKLIDIATTYMEGIGFGEQPFLVYQHFDAGHPHLHIATVNIKNGGQRIDTHNLGKTKSEKIRKEIEVSFGLIKAEEQRKNYGVGMETEPLERVIYGKLETRKAITNVVCEVLKTYKFCSLPELNAVLNQFGVYAFGGAPGSQMLKKEGLIYGILDENNQKIGVPIKASAIYSKPTLKHLKKLFAANKPGRKPYGQRIKLLLDDALKKCRDRIELEKSLHKHGVRIIFRKNAMGNLQGVTLIDNANRVVFNGSSLGKKYAAKGLTEALAGVALSGAAEPKHSSSAEKPLLPQNEAETMGANLGSIPCSDLPVIETILDTLAYDEHELDEFAPFKKKRKKLQLSV